MPIFSGWDFRTFRKWTLYVGGLGGFFVVGTVNLVYGREVNPAIYVLLAGMLGLDSVLNRDAQSKVNEVAKVAAQTSGVARDVEARSDDGSGDGS